MIPLFGNLKYHLVCMVCMVRMLFVITQYVKMQMIRLDVYKDEK